MEPEPDAGTPPEEDDPPVPMTPVQVPDAGAPDADAPTVAFDCSTVPSAPVTFEELPGFTSSEDFVFDELGNYVGFDDNGNLVRINKAGEKQLWLPAVASAAGMAILPDGSVIICDVGQGALKRVYPNGAVTTVLGGLLYPNGVDIGPDGFIYVAENSGGRVRRVNPDTGEFSVVALGLHGPNGVAFTDDPSLLYVGSFEGSGVYKIELPAPGELGRASVFARPNGSELPDPVIACPGDVEGTDCHTEWYGPGKCQAIANVIDCLPVDPCVDLPDGTECLFPNFGYCRAGKCEEPPNPCDDLAEGAACEDPLSGPGVCQSSFGELICLPRDPCYGLEPGAACEDPFFGPGVCEGEAGYLYCQYPDPCAGRSPGDACEDPFYGPGTCESAGVPVPDPGVPLPEPGVPMPVPSGPAAALSVIVGVPSGPEGPPGSDYLYCQPINFCEDASVGDPCEDPFFGAGECAAEGAYKYCAPVNVCDDLGEGAPCEDPYAGEGTCVALDDGLACIPPSVCDDLEQWEPCQEGFFTGVCVPYQGHLYCGSPNVCDSLTEGAPCTDGLVADGVCTDIDGRLLCLPPPACGGLSAGDACTDPYNGLIAGVCTEGEDGLLYCTPFDPCGGLSAGAACTDPNVGVGDGVCTDFDGILYCVSAACVGLEDGAVCEDSQYGAGQCYGGICVTGSSGTPGGIDGMGVDTCGNVYATEYTNGKVWRISPAGEIELLVVLPSGWIPNVKWGRDLGGFSSQVMYVADRDQGRLFGVSVGVPGAKEFFERAP